MPHVIVKLWPGRTEEQKRDLTRRIAEDVVSALKCSDKSVSIAIEEIDEHDWPEKVYKPDIVERSTTLYKKPGYNPFA